MPSAGTEHVTRRLGWALVASHAAVFVVTALVVRELAVHLHWSANPTGWWWQ